MKAISVYRPSIFASFMLAAAVVLFNFCSLQAKVVAPPNDLSSLNITRFQEDSLTAPTDAETISPENLLDEQRKMNKSRAKNIHVVDGTTFFVREGSLFAKVVHEKEVQSLPTLAPKQTPKDQVVRLEVTPTIGVQQQPPGKQAATAVLNNPIGQNPSLGSMAGHNCTATLTTNQFRTKGNALQTRNAKPCEWPAEYVPNQPKSIALNPAGTYALQLMHYIANRPPPVVA